MTPDNSDLSIAWKKSRSGARAGRGFHYQYLVSVALLIRQWAGLFPTAYIVPEGLDDCVIELEEHEIWVQIKSKESGIFGKTEVEKHLDKIDSQVASSGSKKKIYTSIVLEQPRPGAKEKGVDNIFDQLTRNVIWFNDPLEDAIQNVVSTLQVVDVIAEGIISDLYFLVARYSAENRPSSYRERRRISVSEVEFRINERLEADVIPPFITAVISRGFKPLSTSA